MNITFEGKAKVIADFEGYQTITDLITSMGGDGDALNPFQLFLVSIGCCTGLFARQYMEKHQIDLSDKKIEISFDFNETHDLAKVHVVLFVGQNFPAALENPLINVCKSCKVKKQINPDIEFSYTIDRH